MPNYFGVRPHESRPGSMLRHILTLLLCVSQAAANHYKTLGVSRDADQSALKKAYRRLALECHPDKQGETSEAEKKEAERAFIAVSNAYEVLSDPGKRKVYDTFGEAGPKGGGNAASAMDLAKAMELLKSMDFFKDLFGSGGFGDAFGDAFRSNVDSNGGVFTELVKQRVKQKMQQRQQARAGSSYSSAKPGGAANGLGSKIPDLMQGMGSKFPDLMNQPFQQKVQQPRAHKQPIKLSGGGIELNII